MLGLWSKLLGAETLGLAALSYKEPADSPEKLPTTQAQVMITPGITRSLPILAAKKAHPLSAGLPSTSYGLPMPSERSGSGTVCCSPFLVKSFALPARLTAGTQCRAIS